MPSRRIRPGPAGPAGTQLEKKTFIALMQERVRLTIRCRNLPNLDLDQPDCTNTASDPICGVFCDGAEIGRTEFIKDNPDPNFKTAVEVSFVPGEEKILTFRVYDLDYLGHNGEVNCGPHVATMLHFLVLL